MIGQSTVVFSSLKTSAIGVIQSVAVQSQVHGAPPLLPAPRPPGDPYGIAKRHVARYVSAVIGNLQVAHFSSSSWRPAGSPYGDAVSSTVVANTLRR
jgi:hypothetical protein